MWWFNLRASNTEPLLRLNVEAADHATMAGCATRYSPSSEGDLDRTGPDVDLIALQSGRRGPR